MDGKHTAVLCNLRIPVENFPMQIDSESNKKEETHQEIKFSQDNDHETHDQASGQTDTHEGLVETGSHNQHHSNAVQVDEAAVTALKHYKKRVLTPFNVILKTIGLRPLCKGNGRCHACAKFTKYLTPIMIFILLLIGTISQLASCFFRYRSTPIGRNNVIQCEDRIVTYAIIPYIVILVAYLLSAYAFIKAEPDQLYPLANSSFNSFRGVTASKSRSRPYHILTFIFSFGMLYLGLSIGASALRMLALKLESSSTVIAWFSRDPSSSAPQLTLKLSPPFVYLIVHYILVVIDMIGFVLFDLLFVAIVVNYCSQCVLLTLYIENVEDKVRNRKYSNLYEAADEIQMIQDHLKKFNGKIAAVTSLYYFIFVVYLVLSYSELSTGTDNPVINEASGFMNTIQWLIAVIATPIMAVRLTVAGNGLKRLGQEIAGHSVYYKDRVHYTNMDIHPWVGNDEYYQQELVKNLILRSNDIHKDTELQFFQQFTESTRYNAKLMFIPMQPGLVLGLALLFLFLFCTGIIIPHVQSVNWF